MKDIRFCFLVYSVLRIGPTLIPNSLLKIEKKHFPLSPCCTHIAHKVIQGGTWHFFFIEGISIDVVEGLDLCSRYACSIVP